MLAKLDGGRRRVERLGTKRRKSTARGPGVGRGASHTQVGSPSREQRPCSAGGDELLDARALLSEEGHRWARVEIPEEEGVDQLGLPQAVHSVLNEKKGLVLVTGPTGSGKSTSLASMINKINRERAEHIITIEDPVEFVHSEIKSIISQREVGRDTVSFASALKGALREDPDILLLGEMRDYETISLALTAAETGHLVFGTLHTSGAAETINRIIDAFPAEEQPQARSMVASSLQLVMTQQLLKRKSGGRIGAFEVMVCVPAIKNLIREDKIPQIATVMQTGAQFGMITMEKYVDELEKQGLIAIEDD